MVCGDQVGTQGHHVIEKSYLKRNGLGRLRWDQRNFMPLCQRHHSRHTGAFQRVPRHLLSAANWAFARELGLEWYLERYYPNGGLLR